MMECGVDSAVLALAGDGRWTKQNITYSFTNFTVDLTQAEIRSAVKTAFDVWSRVTGLKFTEVPDDGNIQIGFFTGKHGHHPNEGDKVFENGTPSGRASLPGHAASEFKLFLHFNDSITWSLSPTPFDSSSEDIHLTALHEIGHNLGLDHSTNEDAIMYPALVDDGRRELHFDDVNRIQARYHIDGLVLKEFGGKAGGWLAGRHPRLLADVNNDGNLDIVGFGDKGVYLALGDGHGSFGPKELRLKDFGREAGGWLVGRHPRMLADVNNDGNLDIVGFHDSGVMVAFGDGRGKFSPKELRLKDFGGKAGGWNSNHPRILADVNNDGNLDVVGFGDKGVYIALGDGRGNFGPKELRLKDFGREAGGWLARRHPRLLADVNNDGNLDIVGFHDTGVMVAFGDGRGNFSPKGLRHKGFGRKAGGWNSNHPRILADVNNDGKLDIVGFGDKGVYVALGNGDGTFRLLPN